MLSVSALLPLFPPSAVPPPSPPRLRLAQATASLCLQEAPGFSVPVVLLLQLPSGSPLPPTV